MTLFDSYDCRLRDLNTLSIRKPLDCCELVSKYLFNSAIIASQISYDVYMGMDLFIKSLKNNQFCPFSSGQLAISSGHIHLLHIIGYNCVNILHSLIPVGNIKVYFDVYLPLESLPDLRSMPIVSDDHSDVNRRRRQNSCASILRKLRNHPEKLADS